MEIPAVGACQGFVNPLDEVVASGVRNVETSLVIESAMVEVPIFGGGAGEGDSGGFHGCKGVNDKLVRGSGFGDFGGQGGV